MDRVTYLSMCMEILKITCFFHRVSNQVLLECLKTVRETVCRPRYVRFLEKWNF